ncbi:MULTISPECIES: sensor histidine kinase [unclassified Undibacterium]|uniref:sensor histidine kinase n=2 Tax=Pseudomonadota TaxID=1224 RepID=UPI002AC8B10C|nr:MULTISPECIES: sensor histidine kinase [unclassified Undibacterium]MEB0138318.1 sensor histidine kinase [Undibacterium sp. CCC2.1]MEB0172695.1 sensor histidine kinase [Undibacterium sp. CCC1.1]MEB0174693.1 sensor histidine kinase [Undibacterium sp. CCC3.4]MEB0213890.1 sensor histidine kinase [Undibacterium sp. 5I2]WPX42616.1 sensor histidine kinase [Undibacterium sp. CCC3.4]
MSNATQGQTSIRRSLLKWLIAPLLLVNMIGGGLVYWLAWTPAQIAFDQSLADTCWVLGTRLTQEPDQQIRVDLPSPVEQVLRFDHYNTIYFAIRDSHQATLAGDRDFPLLPPPPTLREPHFFNGKMRGEEIRIVNISFTIGDQTILIQAAETLKKRNAIQARIITALMLIEGLLTIFLLGVAWMAVTKGLLPLKNIQTDLNARNFDELSALPVQETALELSPVVSAINRLLRKIEIGSHAQQEFLANIAHQLRTPLAGLKAQIEWLQEKYADETHTARSVALMMMSTERMIRQTNQLLALARAEPSKFEKNRLEALSLELIVTDCMPNFLAAADRKHIDLGFNLQAATIFADAFLLRDLIENLIDNALSYTQAGGIVTVSTETRADAVIFSVEDNGPGIPEAERALVFQRHYRINESSQNKVSGNGIGLAIVADIVKDHNAHISIADAAGGGTLFAVLFPRQKD